MPRYHINIHDEPVRCPAQKKCRAKGGPVDSNGEVEHFEGSFKEAVAWAEGKNAEAVGGNFSTHKKQETPSKYDNEPRELLKALEEDLRWGDRGRYISQKYLDAIEGKDSSSVLGAVRIIEQGVNESSSGALSFEEKEKVKEEILRDYQQNVQENEEYNDSSSDPLYESIKYSLVYSVADAIRDKHIRMQSINERADDLYRFKMNAYREGLFSDENIKRSEILRDRNHLAELESWSTMNELNKRHGSLSEDEIMSYSSKIGSEFSDDMDKRGERSAVESLYSKSLNEVMNKTQEKE